MKIRGMKERLIVGLKWEGTFEKAFRGDIRKVIKEVSRRKDEIENKVNDHEFAGVSIHDRRGGFTHYAGWEVKEGTPVPSGFEMCHLPEADYLIFRHKKSKNIGDSYTEVLQNIHERGLTALKPEEVDSYDELPIKIELYPADRVLDEEMEFEIHIPVIK
ncbi:GyrI-like domain-containing protein [Salipaludibacillus aurantiacus]|uniref:Predicted transcriptional regulator YdeE, contains AraC-type DNA-binding domain n=1 Tax=Salipaludibacillus aurantiacus TaxID=1601833 RepID=A0A1H9X5I9_9BACI|nr:GyrI-like domain-containing protein [Salipaludibacillus aurantiacus]SES41456.1 Predicted transcriptional regulator YdeE, contains AraC-type DNA-binding domain [Salipaludibacillus aurantiacus]